VAVAVVRLILLQAALAAQVVVALVGIQMQTEQMELRILAAAVVAQVVVQMLQGLAQQVVRVSSSSKLLTRLRQRSQQVSRKPTPLLEGSRCTPSQQHRLLVKR
jgi:tryptophan synthase beta subunit